MKPSTHNNVYQQGQAEFARHFKNYLKKRRNWNVELQWGEDNQKDQTYVAVEIHAAIILTIDHEDIETFGTAFQDTLYQTALLEKRERDLVKKMQQKQK